MSESPLEGFRAKVDRASEHLAALDPELAAWLDRHRQVLDREYESNSGYHVFRFKPPEEPPPRWGAVVGDIAHNLRSALDHLAWQLVGVVGGRADRDTQFPIIPTNSSDFAAETNRRLNGVAEGMPIWTAIEGLQPYHRAKPRYHPLAVLNWLSKIDKHRVLHSSFLLFAEPDPNTHLSITWAGEESDLLDFKVSLHAGMFLDKGAEIFRVRFAGDPDRYMKVDAKLPIDIAFGDRGEIQVKAVTLNTIRDYVSESIQLFERFFVTWDQRPWRFFNSLLGP